MEIRARYLLIGLFVLVVIAGGFGFVFWLNTTGGLAARTTYRVAFDGPVSGLLNGSAVLFNGLRVGEVTRLEFDPSNPHGVSALIAIDARVPVRAPHRIKALPKQTAACIRAVCFTLNRSRIMVSMPRRSGLPSAGKRNRGFRPVPACG